MLVACGWVPWLPGFASTADLASLQRAFTIQQARLLEQSLLDMRTRQCKAVHTNNPDAKRFAAERVASLSVEYRDLTGHHYQLPNCDEL